MQRTSISDWCAANAVDVSWESALPTNLIADESHSISTQKLAPWEKRRGDKE